MSQGTNDSCVNKLVSVVHSIYSDFDCNQSLEVRGIFLDISEAFDKVWHDVSYKLETLGFQEIFQSILKILSGHS